MNNITTILAQLQQGDVLSNAAAEIMFGAIMDGQLNDAQIGAILAMLALRGEHPNEVTAAARIMRSKAKKFNAPQGAMDIVGTGGDKLGTLNISTTTSLVVAGAGVKVAKHGNKSVTSLSGTADVQTALGINIMADSTVMEQAVRDVNIGFMMAPLYHSAMKHVMPARTSLPFKTIFNILGPLTNPAEVRYYLMGCFAKKWMDSMATALCALGVDKAWIVHSDDGMDELSICAPTSVVEIHHDVITHHSVAPEDYGLPRYHLADIKGQDAAYNATRISQLLQGQEQGAFYDAIVLNSAAALYIVGHVATMHDGVVQARHVIDSGKAWQTLQQLVTITNS